MKWANALKNDTNRCHKHSICQKKKKKLHLLKQSMIKQGIPIFVPLASSFPKYTQKNTRFHDH